MRALIPMLLAASLFAADVTGKWSGSYDVSMTDGQTMKGRVYMVLTQTGSDLTGTVGGDEQSQTPIKNGKIEGDRITFESQTEGPLMRFDLRLEDEHIRGKASGDMDGGTILAKLDLTRQ